MPLAQLGTASKVNFKGFGTGVLKLCLASGGPVSKGATEEASPSCMGYRQMKETPRRAQVPATRRRRRPVRACSLSVSPAKFRLPSVCCSLPNVDSARPPPSTLQPHHALVIKVTLVPRSHNPPHSIDATHDPFSASRVAISPHATLRTSTAILPPLCPTSTPRP